MRGSKCGCTTFGSRDDANGVVNDDAGAGEMTAAAAEAAVDAACDMVAASEAADADANAAEDDTPPMSTIAAKESGVAFFFDAEDGGGVAGPTSGVADAVAEEAASLVDFVSTVELFGSCSMSFAISAGLQ